MRYLILFTILLFPNLAADGREVFNKNFQGVVLIITDDGIGSGAIITEAGHVLTNAHVINDNAVPITDIANDIHDFGDIWLWTTFIDDGQVRVIEKLGDGSGSNHATVIG